jgi:5'-3' exonuclease
VFRAYYSVPMEFVDSDGAPTHAVYGFLGTLLGLLEQARPTHLAIAFDVSLTTSFRNRIYPAYKAHRELPPADIDAQFRYCRELVEALGLVGLAHDTYEADDLIGALLVRLRAHGFAGVIVSADKDLAQLIGEHDQMWDFPKARPHGAHGVIERLGVRPDQVVDLLALTGDSVDNIPGVPGVGPKTAQALLGHFGTLDQLLARLDEVPYLRLRGAASAAAKIRTHRQQALLSRELATIALDAPTPEVPEALVPRAPDRARVEALLDRLRFGPMTRRRINDYAARFA